MRHLGDGRGPPVALRQLVDGLLGADVQVVHPPRRPNPPAPVTKVALQLAEDRRGGERRQLGASGQVEPLDRFKEADQRNLVRSSMSSPRWAKRLANE